jgi:hypothetical protein
MRKTDLNIRIFDAHLKFSLQVLEHFTKVLYNGKEIKR